jgi:hypothetical protein
MNTIQIKRTTKTGRDYFHESLKDVPKKYNKGHISEVLSGERKHTGGCTFKYAVMYEVVEHEYFNSASIKSLIGAFSADYSVNEINKYIHLLSYISLTINSERFWKTTYTMKSTQLKMVQIPSTKLKKILGRDYLKMINVLIDMRLVQEDGSYLSKSTNFRKAKSKGYRLTF